MKLFDVNILIAAHREDHELHRQIHPWFNHEISRNAAFGMSELVLSAFLRIVTNPRSFSAPTSPAQALFEVDKLASRANCLLLRPGPRHFELFLKLCRDHNARGNLVPDVYLAALAMEHGCEWVSGDGGFGRFAGLNWTRPPGNQ
jgi:hypothetical protein